VVAVREEEQGTQLAQCEVELAGGLEDAALGRLHQVRHEAEQLVGQLVGGWRRYLHLRKHIGRATFALKRRTVASRTLQLSFTTIGRNRRWT
jgi:hypothetical protein